MSANAERFNESLNALPLEIRKGLLGGMPIGSTIILEFAGPDELACEVHRTSGTIFQCAPMTKDEVIDRLLTEDTVVAFLPGPKP